MTKKRSMTVLVVVLAAAVVLTGGLMASNMGFKLNRALVAAGTAGSVSGTQTLSLPYNRQVGIDTASDLFVDIGSAFNLQRYETSTDLFQFYSFGSPDFALAAGEGLFVQVGTDTNYIIVGSHDPAAVIQLEGPGAASLSGATLFAPPYHATAATARDLFVELGITNVFNIQRWDTTTDLYQFYSFGSTDFPITPGEAYFVSMGTTLAYSPSHY